jgi:2-haloalkanoic acid dehalogenase type II
MPIEPLQAIVTRAVDMIQEAEIVGGKMIREAPVAITFDCYSALVDSRTGVTRAFAELAQVRGWSVDAAELAGYWDACNKALQRDTAVWASYRALARRAMIEAIDRFGLRGDPDADTATILATIPRWPHYTDVPDGVAPVAERYPVALLSNIDDDLLAVTRCGYPFSRAVTSEQARCYKPNVGIYLHAQQQLGTPLLHVPASARDVRGAMEAGLEVVRVVRPGHQLDPDGPTPETSIGGLRELADLLP